MAHSLEKLVRHSESLTLANACGKPQEPLGTRLMTCEVHGDYESSGTRYMGLREIWTRCQDCEDARLAAERQAEANRKAQEARSRMEFLLSEALIPARFLSRNFDNFRAETKEQKAALAVSRAYAENFESIRKRGDGLVFSGLPGTGKSHLATSILQAILPEHCGLYMTCMGLIREVRNTWRKDSERGEAEVLRIVASVPLLVLDEIGVQYGTDGEQTILFEVLDRRYRDMKPTILLTNQAKQGLKDFIGERSFDRLTETSKWVSFDWSSYRPQARKDAA